MAVAEATPDRTRLTGQLTRLAWDARSIVADTAFAG
jgi:hypothetical protein